MAESSWASCPSSDAIIYALIAAFEATALFNIVELSIKAVLTFKHRSGIYFWSLIIAAGGTAVNTLGLMFKFFVDESPWPFHALLATFGWMAMVTGHSFLLWSRLHLVRPNKLILRSVLGLIMFNALCLHIPTSIFFIGYCSPDSDLWRPKLAVMEKIQQTMFVVQELIICTLYIRAAIRLRPSASGKDHARRVLTQLMVVMGLVVAMDLILLALSYTEHWDILVNLRLLIYSLKLRLEFTVFNKLMVLCAHGFGPKSHLTGGGRVASLGMLEGVDSVQGIFKFMDFEQEISSAKPSMTLYEGSTADGETQNSSVVVGAGSKRRPISSIDPLSSNESESRQGSRTSRKNFQPRNVMSRLRQR